MFVYTVDDVIGLVLLVCFALGGGLYALCSLAWGESK